MKKHILFSLITGLMIAVGATQAAAPRAGDLGQQLIEAQRVNDIEEVQELIAAGADVNAQNDGGPWTALMWAIRNDHTDVAQVLIAVEGIDVNFQDVLGTTPLMVAANAGHADVVQALIDAGADVNAQDSNGETALMCAAQKDHVDVVQALLAAGADPTPRRMQGKTAADDAAANGEISQKLSQAVEGPKTKATRKR